MHRNNLCFFLWINIQNNMFLVCIIILLSRPLILVEYSCHCICSNWKIVRRNMFDLMAKWFKLVLWADCVFGRDPVSGRTTCPVLRQVLRVWLPLAIQLCPECGRLVKGEENHKRAASSRTGRSCRHLKMGKKRNRTFVLMVCLRRRFRGFHLRNHHRGRWNRRPICGNRFRLCCHGLNEWERVNR